jgi:riboflavin synthase
MFTGIVQAIGTVSSVESRAGDWRLSIGVPDLDLSGFKSGESICVNGVCLTAIDLGAHSFSADVSTETMTVTALGALKAGARVNIEPSLALGDRLGGHMVSGHVDCVGLVVSRKHDARSLRLEVEIPAEFSRYVARKGSVAVDGVSLTINQASATTMQLNIIPHTAESTIMGEYRTGTRVNIEVDIVARYIERMLSDADNSGISMETLREYGYAK